MSRLRLPDARTPVTRGRMRTASARLAAIGVIAVVAAGCGTGSSSGPGAGSAGAGGHWQSVGGTPFRADGVVRTYYLGADEVVWDYAPDGRNDVTGQAFDDVADTYVQAGRGRVGSRYLKCVYRAYTDDSFSRLAPRPADEAYLGVLGPVIRAEVGDTIEVEFRNACPFAATVHPHGVLYDKDSEGAPYDDGTSASDKDDDAVPTGGRHTYVWQVPERAGPGPGDGSSVMWMYHSHTDEVADTNAGLIGPIEVTRAGMARPDGSPKDVDHEVFTLFSVMNENESPLLPASLRRFGRPPYAPPGDEEFEESNLMHSINGFVFGNLPMPVLRSGEHVRWYVMSMGTEVDLHTPHWHGNDVTVNGMRTDSIGLLPGMMTVADMVPDDPGTWLLHCHVNDHITAGMVGRYRVTG